MEQGDFFAVPLAFSFVFLCVLCVRLGGETGVSAVKEVVGEKALQVGEPAARLLAYEEGPPGGPRTKG